MSSQKFASVIILSFKRKDYLARSLQTLHSHTPRCELIVVDDGSRGEVWTYLFQELRDKRISTLVLNGGPNRGVGEGIRRGFAIADPRSSYLVKSDADLEYHDGWLEAGVWILDNMPDIACVGWFDYLHYDKTREGEFGTIETRETGYILPSSTIAEGPHLKVKIVKDFVSSAMMIRRTEFEKYGPLDTGSEAFAEDVMWKRKMQALGFNLAITSPDLITNIGFGLGKSVVVVPDSEGKPVVTRFSREPFLV